MLYQIQLDIYTYMYKFIFFVKEKKCFLFKFFEKPRKKSRLSFFLSIPVMKCERHLNRSSLYSYIFLIN